MNKHEVIKELMSKSREIIFGDDENVYLSRKRTIELVSQIHEPQTVLVPKFVAEWIEYCKSNKLTLLGAFDPVSEHGIGLANTFTGEVWKGVDWAKRNQETFARAW
ncbi:DUF1642 domain-containing protein, partial [Streptococcus suis]|nr:DUF1642 domain-containing protein [Streptococcus suis]